MIDEPATFATCLTCDEYYANCLCHEPEDWDEEEEGLPCPTCGAEEWDCYCGGDPEGWEDEPAEDEEEPDCCAVDGTPCAACGKATCDECAETCVKCARRVCVFCVMDQRTGGNPDPDLPFEEWDVLQDNLVCRGGCSQETEDPPF